MHPGRALGRILSMRPTSKEEIELDRLWREVFKQPLPMLGAPDIARTILNEHMAKTAKA